jgi:hypothetical protein
MKSKNYKKISILLAFVLLTVMMTATAFALTSSDPYVTPPVNGHTYSFTSEVWDRKISGVSTVEAVASVDADGSVPTGYMGADARLFDSSAKVVASSLAYNTSSTAGFYVYSPRISTPGQYYAKNIGYFYNGNGYTSYPGYQSPIQTLSSSKAESTAKAEETLEEIASRTEYAVNDNGETYGSALSADTIGMEPDLIAAVGTNGVNGYVRAEELAPEVSTIEEALALMGENGSIRTIPLYAVDGTTVIGQFDIVTNYELVTDTE